MAAQSPIAVQPNQLHWHSPDNYSGRFGWDFEALRRYASKIRHEVDGVDYSCQLSAEYNVGGGSVVKRIEFEDGCQWVAKLRERPSQVSTGSGANTMAAVRALSAIPVPRVFGYDWTGEESNVGTTVTLMEYVPYDNMNDLFGPPINYLSSSVPASLEEKYRKELADIQAQLASVRFDKIGLIVCSGDGGFRVVGIPCLGGPFDTAKEYFEAWADMMGECSFEDRVRVSRDRYPGERETVEATDELVDQISSFPSRVKDLAQWFPFQDGPFPLIHDDLDNTNILIDSNCDIMSVLNWECKIVGPWEAVAMARFLPWTQRGLGYYLDPALTEEYARGEKGYLGYVREAEERRGLDNKLSTVFADKEVQAFAQAYDQYGSTALPLYYNNVLKPLEMRRRGCHPPVDI